jgi:hypothetical protein
MKHLKTMKNKINSTTEKSIQILRGKKSSCLFHTMWLTMLLLTVLLWQCRKDNFKETATLCPAVLTTDPANLATNVPLNQVVRVTFNEPMDPVTIISAAFSLAGPGSKGVSVEGKAAIPGTLSYDAATSTMSFVPASLFAESTTYTGTVSVTVKDLNGNYLQANYVWTFTTGTLPTVISTVPVNTATGVATNSKVTATFSEQMDPLTITSTTFTLKQGLNSILGTVTYTGLIATFTPAANLAANSVFTATITNGAKNVAGNAMVVNYTWNFATGAIPDIIRPTIISTVPLNLATGVALNTKVSATFSEAMDPLTILPANFTLMQGVTSVAGAVTYIGMVATFTPTSNLTASTLYTATVTTGVKDLAGNPMLVNYVWTFTTGTTADVTPPTVISTVPLNAANDVALNSILTATFSEAMDPLTILPATFTLKQGVTSITGAVTYLGLVATFTPSVNLTASTLYTATITTGAKDLAGNAIAVNYVWTFTTGAVVVLPPLGPGAVDLGTAANFAAIGKAGISTTGVSSITGDIGVSPAAATAITGFGLIMDVSNTFSTTPIVVGKVYASDYTPPTPAYMTQAVSDMETALTAAMGMTTSVIVDLGAGDISGMTLVPGLYKFSTGLLITNAGVTLTGGPNDTWVFQIAQDLTVDNTAIVTLSGGALAKNIFWVTSTQAVLGTTVNFKGNILSQTLISVNTGSTVLGRLLAQTAVTLNAATIIKP